MGRRWCPAARALRVLLPTLLALVLVAEGCRSKPRPASPGARPVVSKPRRPAAPLIGVRRPRRAPARGATSRSVVPTQATEPCLELFDEACALYGVGSEECQELRASARRMAPARGRGRCEAALERYRAGELVPPRESACKVLVARRCELLGQNTDGCVAIKRSILRNPDEHRDRACLADLLVLDGVGLD